ncbi:hemerythrin domain-containing protein [Streptomyces orinoci]|uniref:Hemerythrin domain-containing protein n=1 Tax=Streptomyces orinoci TaxID=67339 RepID=A0ABV3K3Z2_STRON|nr:hemerythrin domain-containing protein [Streptomyces orinoci]
MTEQAQQGPGDDVVLLLKEQHVRIRQLFHDVRAASGDQRREAFRELVRMLAVHETAEEEVVHPSARQALGETGDQVVDARLEEERQAKEVLSRLDGMDIDDPEFTALFTTLEQSVLQHAEAEERMEFEQLRANVPPGRLAAMAKAVKAAEAMAPTHPHPGVESRAKNVMLGPIASVMDRTRDVVRKAMGKEG